LGPDCILPSTPENLLNLKNIKILQAVTYNRPRRFKGFYINHHAAVVTSA
jgi:hypothetical protein